MKIDQSVFRSKQTSIEAMRTARLPWWQYWRELADFILPTRYTYLVTPQEQSKNANNRNGNILDGTGTLAARTLAAGMMNGITSPVRPWFKLRVAGGRNRMSSRVQVWLDDTERRMLQVFAKSNTYNSLAVLYLDLDVFGTAAMLVHEDEEDVIHCGNPPLGEFYLMIDAKGRVCGLAREFNYTVYQCVKEFGIENVTDSVATAYRAGGARLHESIQIIHLIEPNDKRAGQLGTSFSHREYFWEAAATDGTVLRTGGYYEFPGICPRWELTSNDAYGTSPAMDALGDIKQLQHETKKKAQGLDKLVSPPVLADITLQHKPMALLPNGITYVPRLRDTDGAKPMYTVNPPLRDMSEDINQVRQRIQFHFHNELFNRVMTLDTVRSAEEIRAIESERLVLLGPVLHRFENEALDPLIERTFAIMYRKGLLEEMPPELEDAELKIQYQSIFSAAQNAVTTGPTERLLQVIGNTAQIWPEAKLILNTPETLYDYALDIGVAAKHLNPIEDVRKQIVAMNEEQAQSKQLMDANAVAAGAKTLSETEVGGGANALQRLLGA